MNIKDYFSFTRGEKRGTVVLLLIVVILIIANFSVDLLKTTSQTDFSEFENKINEFEKEINSESSINQHNNSIIELFDFNPNTISDEEWKKLGFKDWQIKTINNYKAKSGKWKTKDDVSKIYGLSEKHFEQLKPFILLPGSISEKSKSNLNEKPEKPEYFKFNPNTITKVQWKKLGFKDWQIKTIFNYKAKGGNWKTKSDVKKIYGLDETDYNKLEPYILLPDKKEKKINPNNRDFTEKVNINTASKKELTKLKGIYSEKYAAIIIKYRDDFGGFIKKEQLLEVWNMQKETYDGFIKQVVLGNNNKPQQININSASIDQLKKHPYINWNTANAIVKYRKANGNFKKVEDIKKIHLIKNETYLKIEPYLSIF